MINTGPAFRRSHCPASLERPGRAVRGTPVHRAKGPLDPLQYSDSPMPERSTGKSIRYAIPASLWHRPKPSVAWAFGGTKVHRTFVFYRLTHWTFFFFGLTRLSYLAIMAKRAL